jgi:hypothetical protein
LPELDHDPRHDQLREAAEALVAWIHARRTVWADDDLDEDMPGSPLFDVAAALDSRPAAFEHGFADAAAGASAFDDALTDPEVEEEGVSEPRFAAFKPRIQAIVAAAGALVRLVVDMGRKRAAAIAALVAVVGVTWIARPYIESAKTWLAGLTHRPAVPKTEPEAAKPAAPATVRRVGQLMARSDPSGATVVVDGRERGVTPLTLSDLSFGSHTVVLQSEKGSVRRTVNVSATRPAVISESIFAGWLAIFAPFELQVSEGDSGIRLDDTGKVLLAPGPHELKLENRDLGYSETRRVEVQPGQTTSLSLVAPPSTLTVTATTPAVVSIDGQQVGSTPLTSQPIALGTRDIVVTSTEGGERRFTKKVTVAPVQIDVDFSKP